MSLNYGDRIKVIGGPWPERVGLYGHVCHPFDVGTYPFTPQRGHRSDVIILIDNDPLLKPSYDQRWSCAINPGDIEAAS